MAVTADTYGPFATGVGASFGEESWRKMMRHMLGSQSGVIRGFDNECQVYADSTGMQVKVKTGQTFVRGHWAEFASEKTLPIATAHATLARKDRVVLRGDFVNDRIEVDVLTGTAAGSPTVPSLTQTTSVWETHLAVVDVPATDTSIDAGQVANDPMYTSAQGRWRASGSQSVTSGTFNKVNFATTVASSGDITADLTNDTFTLLRSGLWILAGSLRFASGVSAGKRELLIADPANVSGGTCTNILADQTDGGHSAEIHLNAVTIDRYAANQVIAMYGYQDSGSPINTVATNGCVSLSVVWVGP